MKTRRLVSSLALAAAVSLGLTSCGLFVPQATLEPYAPSDGIDITIEQVAVRNLMLIADAANENFNVVFTGVNNGESSQTVRMTFVDEQGSLEADANFNLTPGLTVFGSPDGEARQTIISLRGVEAGATVSAFVEVASGGEVERQVPVLDGTLPEYKAYVPR